MVMKPGWANPATNGSRTNRAFASRIGDASLKLPPVPRDSRGPMCRPGAHTGRRTAPPFVASLVALVLLALFRPVPAGARTAEEAQSLANNAISHVRDVGRERAFADFNNPAGGFVDGELYVFCLDASGVVVAHGGNPNIVGRNLGNVRDPDGRMPNAESIRIGLSEGSGWLEYRWPNPVTKRIELKAAYVLKRVRTKVVRSSGDMC